MKKYRVLIVDDERVLAEIAKMKFPADHFIVNACYDGVTALQEVDHHHPDLIVLDITMPRMDGWEVLSKLKSNPETSTIPVIMLTANNSLADVEKSFSCGAESYLIKPFTSDKLLKKAMEILGIEGLPNG